MAVAAALVFVWLGLVLGLAFVEAPLKFRAPGITRELGLGIGRLMFKALNGSELVLAVATVIALRTGDAGRTAWMLCLVLLTIVVAQAGMIHGAMDQRAAKIVRGETVPPSRLHGIYIGFEIVKVVLLISLGTLLMRQLAG